MDGEGWLIIPRCLLGKLNETIESTQDWDGSAMATIPKVVPIELLEAVVKEASESIAISLVFRRERNMRVLHGGPVAGKPHRLYGPGIIVIHIARAKWAAYHVMADGRGFYRGEATNKRSARLLARQTWEKEESQ